MARWTAPNASSITRNVRPMRASIAPPVARLTSVVPRAAMMAAPTRRPLSAALVMARLPPPPL
jgi:hypothetical protein